VTRIRGAMLDELRSMDWVPRLVRSKTARLNEATKQLENKLGRAPTDAELAAQLQISSEELDQMKLESNTVNLVSLDKKFADDDSNRAVSELDVLDDRRSEDPTRRAQKNDLLRLVTRGLSRVERLILILYYYEEMTMKEVGATLDLSESRVSQMHSSLMQRLQEQLAPRRPELAAE
jgi:RNA polymerase sigma factor for flagellar operon FliA